MPTHNVTRDHLAVRIEELERVGERIVQVIALDTRNFLVITSTSHLSGAVMETRA